MIVMSICNLENTKQANIKHNYFINKNTMCWKFHTCYFHEGSTILLRKKNKIKIEHVVEDLLTIKMSMCACRC
jgi:hypothetical protein